MIPFLTLTLMSGCGLFDKAKNTISGITNQLATNGLVLGVEPPESQLANIIPPPYNEGTSATIFVADASNNAPVDGAEVSVDAVLATGQGGGTYTIDPKAGLSYQAGQIWELAVAIPDRDDGIATLTLPPPANVKVPNRHDAQADLDIDVEGQGYHWMLIFVIETGSGSVTFSNDPQTVNDYLDLIRTNEIDSETIPGDAFPGAGLYAVGLAGMKNTSKDDIENMNTVASTVSAGKLKWYAVQVTN